VDGEFSNVGSDVSTNLETPRQAEFDVIAQAVTKQTRILVATATLVYLPPCIYLWVIALT